MRFCTLLPANLALVSSAFALGPHFPRMTQGALQPLNARQDAAQETTAPDPSETVSRSDCASSVDSFWADRPVPVVTDAVLLSYYQSQLDAMTVVLSVSNQNYKDAQDNYSAWCTEHFREWAVTHTVPASLSSAHSDYFSTWNSDISSIRPDVYSLASQCLFQDPAKDSVYAGGVLLGVATDVDSCISAYEVMAFGAASFVDARTTGAGTNSRATTISTSTQDGGVMARETGLVMAAVAVAGVVGAGMV
ncbi:hypothetical protein QBC44DRAFT_311215 [Cladorrhinum sp. PSN332]|nr:hypothetical protein QBC44DRAFT_311215 [Cladorrhinum sp. PSN332]